MTIKRIYIVHTRPVCIVALLLASLLLLMLLPTAHVEAQQVANPSAGVLPATTAAAATRRSQSAPPRTAATASSVYAIRNARIVTVSGADIEAGTVVVRDGKIAAVGRDISVPSGALAIDGRGLTIYPGMIDLGTSLGLVEVAAGAPGTVDLAEVGNMNPNARAIVAINPHSKHINVTRVSGVTSALAMPRGGTISGQAALINLHGTSPAEMSVESSAALVINFPRISTPGFEFLWAQQAPPSNLTEVLTARDRQVEQLRKMLRDAEAYGKAQDAYRADSSLPRPAQSAVLAALVPFVRGERRVIMRADREAEIRAAIRFADEMKLKPVILSGNDAWKVTSLLKERNVPVILTGTLSLPMREDDPYDVMFENAAKLHRAGIQFAISTGDTGAHVRDLPFHAGMAAAYGLPQTEALRAVTLYPAQIMNVADRLGSIEVGKIANLVVTDGDLLEPRTNIRFLFINGQQLPLTNRHTELYEQFKNRGQ